jgi:hypothetical protein
VPIIPAPPTPTTSMLDDVYDFANTKSYQSKSDKEIWQAINEAGFNVYSAVLKESEGFYVKIDESSIVLTAGTSTYALPSDFSQLLHMAGRTTPSDDWRPIEPATVNEVTVIQNFNPNNWFAYGPQSQFQFWMYQDTLQQWWVKVSPQPQETHSVQLIYAAKWVVLTKDSDTCMLPLEAQYAVQNFAAAELQRSNNDDLSVQYEAKAEKDLTRFLTWIRARQVQRLPQIEPFLGWTF